MREQWIVNLTEVDSEIWDMDIECNSREDAITEGMEMAIQEGLESFRIGKAIPCGIPYIDGEDLVTRACEQLYDEVGEVAEDYSNSITTDLVKELETEINELFYQWHKKHNLEPKCYTIEECETIKVREDGKNERD